MKKKLKHEREPLKQPFLSIELKNIIFNDDQMSSQNDELVEKFTSNHLLNFPTDLPLFDQVCSLIFFLSFEKIGALSMHQRQALDYITYGLNEALQKEENLDEITKISSIYMLRFYNQIRYITGFRKSRKEKPTIINKLEKTVLALMNKRR